MLLFRKVISNGSIVTSFLPLTYFHSMPTANVSKDGATRRVTLRVRFAARSAIYISYMVPMLLCFCIWWPLTPKQWYTRLQQAENTYLTDSLPLYFFFLHPSKTLGQLFVSYCLNVQLQQFKPGYTAPSPLFRYGTVPLNFRYLLYILFFKLWISVLTFNL